MAAMKRAERRYTPRRQRCAEPSEEVAKEADQLARQVGRRLRLSGAATEAEFERLRLPDDPVARFAAVLDLAEEKARTLPPAVVENTMRFAIWRRRLQEFADGRGYAGGSGRQRQPSSSR